MRLLASLNLNLLKVFETVYRLSSMTKAAKELSLTQSAISQQIKQLETSLGVQLFDRVKLRLQPSAAATQLYLKLSGGLKEIENTLLEIRGLETNLSGEVRIGAPPEFGDIVLMPRISRFLKTHRHIQIMVRTGDSNEINESILNSELDFGFVDALYHDRRVKTQPVFEEIIELCASPDYLKSVAMPTRKSDYEKLDYVAYLEKEPFLRLWFGHHLKSKSMKLNVRAYANTCQSIGELILGGVGVGVLPSQTVESWEASGAKLVRFSGSDRPLYNQISIAHLDDQGLTITARSLLNWLISEFNFRPTS